MFQRSGAHGGRVQARVLERGGARLGQAVVKAPRQGAGIAVAGQVRMHAGLVAGLQV